MSGGTWSPSAGLVGVAWTGAVAAAVWCTQLIGTADVPGLLLAAAATVGLVLAALYGTRARPRLRADGDGVTVRGLTTRTVPWAQIRDVRAQAVRRWGRDSTMLELDVVEPDGAERLLVFGRLDLGDDPVDVAEAVRAARPPTP
ncbi:PH domain-containing protein [Pseudonocardia charpentierae]|uniref:PH domain-containing protein n=1 Tax=Pseudonocardia charpentierae TaxID=3075545 RepID=A0ABU2N358_9PSEU|nr:PH domain-containing protein [Pseudonocardia sp. DSM 45834]MDT0348352.1 PH domain-containing protein [Pseudonocardia sp. DSM 45834]